MLNPCFYLLIGSYVYLTLSSFLLKRYLAVYSSIDLFRFKPESIQITNLFCNWFTLVFFVFYIFSVEPKNIISRFKPKAKTYQIAIGFTMLTSLILLIVTVAYAPTLITFTTRLDVFRFYVDEIFFKYKIALLINILLGSLAVIVWRTKNFRWYIVLLIPIILDLLAKGRTMSFVCLVFAYINYVIITKKASIFKITILLLGIIATGILRHNFSFSWDGLVLRLFSEVILTRFTTILVYDHFMNSGDLVIYLFQSLFRLLPNSITDLLLDSEPGYIVVVGKFAASKVPGATFSGLAGNLVSEALFYGGITFAIVSPLIIGSIFYSLNRLRIYKTFPGFIFFCFLISNLLKMMRASFYDQFLIFIYLMFSYLIWITIWEGGRVVFVKIINFKVKT